MKLHQVRLEGLIKRLEAERGMGRKVRLLAGAWPLCGNRTNILKFLSLFS